MKPIYTLFSVIAVMMALNMPSIGAPLPPPPGCTNVTVKYVGGTPYSQNHVDAYKYIPCTADGQEEYYYTFKPREDTLTIKQNTNLQIAPANRDFGNDIHESAGTRSQINIECPCDEHGRCSGCHIVSSH